MFHDCYRLLVSVLILVYQSTYQCTEQEEGTGSLIIPLLNLVHIFGLHDRKPIAKISLKLLFHVNRDYLFFLKSYI